MRRRWKEKKNEKKKNSQGKDLGTLEEHSQGVDPRTLKGNIQGADSSIYSLWDHWKQVRCIKDMWRKTRKRREGKNIERAAGRKDITRKGSGGKGAESLPKRSLDEKKEKGRERRKKRHMKEKEKEDGE